MGKPLDRKSKTRLAGVFYVAASVAIASFIVSASALHAQSKFEDMTLNFKNLSDQLLCSPEGFFEDFCSLISVLDTLEDFERLGKKCAGEQSLSEILEVQNFSCSDKVYHDQEMSVLSHLSIQIPTFGKDFRKLFLPYMANGTPERFAALLNRKDTRGRTFLDIYKEMKEAGGLPVSDRTVEKTAYRACAYGATYNAYPHPEDCKSGDLTATADRISRTKGKGFIPADTPGYFGLITIE